MSAFSRFVDQVKKRVGADEAAAEGGAPAADHEHIKAQLFLALSRSLKEVGAAVLSGAWPSKGEREGDGGTERERE